MLTPFHPASAVAKYLGCELLSIFFCQLWSSCGILCTVAARTLICRTSPWTQPCSRGVEASPHTVFYQCRRIECRGAWSFLTARSCSAAERRSSPLALPWQPKNHCLIKTILSVAHTHALYTQRDTEMFQAPLSPYEQNLIAPHLLFTKSAVSVGFLPPHGASAGW